MTGKNAGTLKGRPLRGRLILEVPDQDIPANILAKAKSLKIEIRPVKGIR